MASRNLHPSGRPQQQKARSQGNEGFSIRRPLVESSALVLCRALDLLLESDGIPGTSQFQDPADMGVSYIEKGKMDRLLRGWAIGFDTRGLVDSVTADETMRKPLKVVLGRVGLMGTRKQMVVVRLSHSQEVATEYADITDGLSRANIPGVHRNSFAPHISLLRLPNEPAEVKRDTLSAIQDVLPDEVLLAPIETYIPPKR